jgi:phosphate transport system substrate-binding protein
MKKILSFIFATFLCLLGVSSGARADMVKLNGAGATFPYPIYSKWFSEYNKLNPDVQINYQSIGSGGGIQQIKAKTVDFGASDAPLSGDEEKAMPGPVVQIPTVAGSVVVAYNLQGIGKGLKLSPDTLADIFMGKIKRWGDSKIKADNPGLPLPDTSISVVTRSDGSGTNYIFTDYLAKVNGDFYWKVGRGKSVNWPAGIGAKGNEGVTGQVKQTPGAIGYVEYAYAVKNNLTYAALKNKAGRFVEPTSESTTAAIAAFSKELQKDVKTSITDAPGENSYPISGLTYLIVYKSQSDTTKGKTLTEFLRWAMTDGQKLTGALYYSPLPAELVKLNETVIASVK